jgi:cell division protein FtsZ
MDTVKQFNNDLAKSTIFCTCEERYHKVIEEFQNNLNTSTILVKDEFLKEKDTEKLIYQSDICYVIIALNQDKDLKIAKHIYETAKKKDITTIGIVVKPSSFENEEDRKTLNLKISQLKNNLDAVVIIDNQVFINNESENMILDDIEKQSDDAVMNTLKAMVNLISVQGLVNMDMAEFKTIMSGNTIGYPAFGCGSGENRARIAAQQAIDSRFIIETLQESTKILLNVEGGSNMDLLEINEIAKKLVESVHCDANIIFGALLNESLKDEIKVSIVAAGY